LTQAERALAGCAFCLCNGIHDIFYGHTVGAGVDVFAMSVLFWFWRKLRKE
jgi:hypothetical protein